MARRDRWKEEVDLLTEEVSRAVAFFEDRRSLWLRRATVPSKPGTSPELCEGFSAYAYRQAHIQYQRADQMLKMPQSKSRDRLGEDGNSTMGSSVSFHVTPLPAVPDQYVSPANK